MLTLLYIAFEFSYDDDIVSWTFALENAVLPY